MAEFEQDLPYFAFGSRTLKLENPFLRGTDVKLVQVIYDEMLRVMKPPRGPMGDRITIDGIFGPQTEQAVKNVQSYFGVAVDGIVGPVTFFLYGQGVGRNTTFGGPAFGSRDLTVGETGGDVTVLQNRLNLYRYADVLGHAANGVYDDATVEAVKAFQSDANDNGDSGLPVTGGVFAATFDAFWLFTYAGGRLLYEGRKGFDVVFLEVLLKEQLTRESGAPYYNGAIDGYFGPQLNRAVLAFQADAGIRQDGVVGPITFFHLGLRNRQAAPEPMPIPEF